MAYRELELTLQSARDLKNVNLLTRMYVYAVASISGDPMTRQCTPTDTLGGRNPSWNATFRFAVPPSAASAGSAWLHVLIRSERALGDRDVGEVVVPLAELLAAADGPGQQPTRLASYQVHTVQRGEPRGVLNVSYRLGPVVAPVTVETAEEKLPVVAYPAPQQPFKQQNPPEPYYQYNHPYDADHDAYATSPQQPYQYHPSHDAYAWPKQPYHQYHHPSHDTYASPQQPFKNQNPAPPQPYHYHPPHDAYAPSPQPFKNQTPQGTPQQPFKPQTPESPQPYHPQHDTYAPPPLSPANGKSSAHGPTQVYTQIIFNGTTPTPRSNSIPSKPDWPKPKPSLTLTQPDSWSKPYYDPTQSNTSTTKTEWSKPSYTPTQPNTSLAKTSSYTSTQPNMSPVKTDHSWPKTTNNTPKQTNTSPITADHASPKPSYSPAQPNTSPIKADRSSTTKPSYTPAQPNISPVKTDHSSPKPSHTPAQPGTTPLKTLSHHHDKVTWANSPKKPAQQDTKVGELAHHLQLLSKIGSGKRLDHSASIGKEQENTKVNDRKTMSATQAVEEHDKIKSKPIDVAYANSMPEGKAVPLSKAVLQHERVTSMPTIITR